MESNVDDEIKMIGNGLELLKTLDPFQRYRVIRYLVRYHNDALREERRKFAQNIDHLPMAELEEPQDYVS